jgi:nucleoside diphosphate kinase
MPVERTLSIIKPDAVAKNVIGEIYSRFEKAGLRVVAARMMHLSRAQAEGFYAVHRERPFFKDLVDFRLSGAVIIQVLEGEGAIAKIQKDSATSGTVGARVNPTSSGDEKSTESGKKSKADWDRAYFTRTV